MACEQVYVRMLGGQIPIDAHFVTSQMDGGLFLFVRINHQFTAGRTEAHHTEDRFDRSDRIGGVNMLV